jgi:hypothetical protein
VKEAIRLGQLPAETEASLFLDTITGPLLARLLIRHEQIDETFVVSVFDWVVARFAENYPRSAHTGK